jgi:hypothetical protein
MLYVTIDALVNAALSSKFGQATACLATLWMAWRLWAFTVRPALLRPNEPRELPYCVPLLGHAVPFFRDAHDTLTRARKYTMSLSMFLQCPFHINQASCLF